MTDTLEAIARRRAIRQFDPTFAMEEGAIEQLLSLAILSPTAFNMQNWRFVVVRDRELRKQIRAVAWNQAQVIDASLFVVLCADLKAWEKEPARYWPSAPEELRAMIMTAMDRYYNGNAVAQRDEAIRSCGKAAQTLMLAAASLGYDSCPISGFDPKAVGELLNLPEDHVIVMSVAIGKGTRAAALRSGQLPLAEVVVDNRF